jgi:hypothetical protein
MIEWETVLVSFCKFNSMLRPSGKKTLCTVAMYGLVTKSMPKEPRAQGEFKPDQTPPNQK